MINMTIARITARGLFGRRRFLLLLPLPVLLVALAALAQALGAEPAEWAEPVLLGLGVAVVLPVMALIVGTGVLGAEIDDGTLVHVLAKPLPRREIIAATPTPNAAQQVEEMLRAAFTTAAECAGMEDEPGRAYRIFLGPAARVRCEDASPIPGGIRAEISVGLR